MLPVTVKTALSRIARKYHDRTLQFIPKVDAWKAMDHDLLWKHVVYQVAIVGRSDAYERLRDSKTAQDQLHYNRLLTLTSQQRAEVIHDVLYSHGVRYASADITRCAKTKALTFNINFLVKHPGGAVGYFAILSQFIHEDMRLDAIQNDLKYIKLKGARDLLAELGLVTRIIALDIRIMNILNRLGANLPESVTSDPNLYALVQDEIIRDVCDPMQITGVAMDRILYRNYNEIMIEIAN